MKPERFLDYRSGSVRLNDFDFKIIVLLIQDVFDEQQLLNKCYFSFLIFIKQKNLLCSFSNYKQPFLRQTKTNYTTNKIKPQFFREDCLISEYNVFVKPIGLFYQAKYNYDCSLTVMCLNTTHRLLVPFIDIINL